MFLPNFEQMFLLDRYYYFCILASDNSNVKEISRIAIIKQFFQIFLFFLTAVSLSTCDLDQGLGPLESKISGTITKFPLGDPPATVDEVRVAALLNFPPSGLGDVFFSDPLPFDNYPFDYELFIPKGDYPAVVLLWKPKGETWSFNSLLSVYGFVPPLRLDLLPVNLTEENPVKDDVDLIALWNFANSDAKMNGTIRFNGTAPANTEALLIVSLTRFPNFDNLLASLIWLSGLPLPITSNQNPRGYQLNVSSGGHEFIGLFWKGVGTPLEELKLLGYYRNPDMPDQAGSVVIPENGSVSNIDFNVDFNLLPDGIRP